MEYRQNKYGEKISVLGYGCMRFTHKGRAIDIDKASEEIMLAYKNGVNYFDTAYIYPGSEVALGQILEKNGIRKNVNIATKLPPYLINSKSGIEKLFNEQCQRLRTDYIDYYLLHMLTDIEGYNKLDKLGIREWIDTKKAEGKIRNIGFSYHGNTDMFIKILDAYDWDFVQIQYNYLDENTQAGRKGLMAAADKGIPVIIMEPLRGGKLVNMLPDKAKEAFDKSNKGWSYAEWGLRWLWNQKQVTCVLSGMNSQEQVNENVRIASEVKADEFTNEDYEIISLVKQEINSKIKVPCTGCGYCMPCPKGVDIPSTFSCYNRMATEGKANARKEFWQTVALRKNSALPSECVRCGKCEAHCPQKISIREHLKEADKALLPWYYRFAAWISKKFLFKK